MNDANTDAPAAKQPFPRSFWTANVTELFERGAFYAMSSLLVQYLLEIGFGNYLPSVLSSTVLWALIYFLPILSGTIADQIGFKRSLLGAFVLLAIGYFLVGLPVWSGMAVLDKTPGDEMTASPLILVLVLAGIVLIGCGGSVVKPCISGTVQKTAGRIGRATLGFAIFYMVINIGSLAGRGASLAARKTFDLSYIFAVAVASSVLALLVVALLYRDPEQEAGEERSAPRKSVLEILKGMVVVLGNARFTLFLLASSGFWFMYNQVYNVIPLYLKRVVDLDPPTDVITAFNPFVIVFFQLLITKLFGKWKPIASVIVGTLIIGISMSVNIIPLFTEGGVRALTLGEWIPIAYVFAALTVGLIAFGELFTSARSFEYIGALSPRGQEGLFLGYANLPVAIGSIISGIGGAALFNEVMCRDAVKLESGLLDLDPFWGSLGWIVLMGIGFLSAFGMWLYNRWIKRHPA